MWHTISYYTDRAFNFMMLGKQPQEVVPIYLGITIVFVFLLMLKMFRGETK